MQESTKVLTPSSKLTQVGGRKPTHHRITSYKMVRDPCNLYTKEPFPQSHAGEQYTVSSSRSLSLSLNSGISAFVSTVKTNMYVYIIA